MHDKCDTDSTGAATHTGNSDSVQLFLFCFYQSEGIDSSLLDGSELFASIFLFENVLFTAGLKNTQSIDVLETIFFQDHTPPLRAP